MLSPTQRAMIAPLRHGEPVPTRQLIDHLYGYRSDGGPDNAGCAIRVQMHKMRAKLRQIGIEIETIGHARGSLGYRIKPECMANLNALLADR